MFYSEPSGNLSYLKSQIEEEASPTAATVPPYETENITVKNHVMVANTKSPQIAAVSYTLGGHDEVFAQFLLSKKNATS